MNHQKAIGNLVNAFVCQYRWLTHLKAASCTLPRGQRGGCRLTWNLLLKRVLDINVCGIGFQFGHLHKKKGMRVYLGCVWRFSYTFWSLKATNDRTWILENFPSTERLFCDIKSLKRDKVVNVVTGLEETVPATDIFIAGFVCKSVSTENNNRQKYKKCIEARRWQGPPCSLLLPPRNIRG